MEEVYERSTTLIHGGCSLLMSFISPHPVYPLGDANHQMSTLAEELARKTDDGSRQQEEITHLLSQIVDLQKKSKSVSGQASNDPDWSRPMDTFQVAFLSPALQILLMSQRLEK